MRSTLIITSTTTSYTTAAAAAAADVTIATLIFVRYLYPSPRSLPYLTLLVSIPFASCCLPFLVLCGWHHDRLFLRGFHGL